MYHKNLSTEEAQKKQKELDKNVLPEKKPRGKWAIFLSQFINPLVYILILVGLVSLSMGKYEELAFIFAVVLVNAVVGFFQENKTEKTLAALKNLIHPTARVIRDDKRQNILAEDIVPQDVVCLSTGEKVPADGVLLEATNLFVNEAILTGESEATEKEEEQKVSMGTIVVNGHAVMRVDKIGGETEIGAIAQSLSDTKEPLTTLQIRLRKLTRILIWISIFLCGGIFLCGWLMGRAPLEMVELSAVLMVAIIPEALLIVVTLVLVLAMRDSLKRNALIRRIFSVETLGSITTICTDKTGTLTEGKMRIAETNFFNDEKAEQIMNLCSNLSDTVEVALWDYLKKQGVSPQEKFDQYKRKAEITFDSKKKYMAVAVASLNDLSKNSLLVKGAPEVVLKMVELSAKERERIIRQIDTWAKRGLKVLALAAGDLPAGNSVEINSKQDLKNLQWEGLIGLWDPPREGVKEVLKGARKSGLKIKVVTGDYHQTAEKIMSFLGLSVGPDEILTGEQLRKVDDEELKSLVHKIRLFARVTPNQKLRIVSALQQQGEIVAMTGDGVNDAPALKKANIGIVVGDATEVAKETADLILLDNNFKTIISAVEAGRLVFENIKKIIFFILSNSFSEIVVILGALLLGWPMPLTIMQILWLHLLCDGPEDFILGFEPKEKETMLEGPKRMDEPLLDKVEICLIFIISSLSGVISLFFYWYFGLRQGNLALGQTMAFVSIAFTSVIYIFSCRTLRKPFWRYGNFWSNPGLFAVVILSVLLAAVITYWPFTQNLLSIVPLGWLHWTLIIAKGFLVVLVIEVAKHFWGHKWSGGVN